MDRESLEREIQELRKQVELLSSKRSSRDEVEKTTEDEGSSDQEEPPGEEEHLSDLRAKLEEFVGTIQKDLREIPASTAVAIFALGVLMGRLIPR